MLTPQETEALFRTLRLAVAEGLSIVFISHKLGEVMAVSDRVLVLRHGRLVGEVGRPRDTDRHELARLMVGAEIAAAGDPGRAGRARRSSSSRGVSTDGPAGPARASTSRSRGGRITGLAGVSGNGQAALAGLVAGTLAPAAGEMRARSARRPGPAGRRAPPSPAASRASPRTATHRLASPR